MSFPNFNIYFFYRFITIWCFITHLLQHITRHIIFVFVPQINRFRWEARWDNYRKQCSYLTKSQHHRGCNPKVSRHTVTILIKNRSSCEIFFRVYRLFHHRTDMFQTMPITFCVDYFTNQNQIAWRLDMYFLRLVVTNKKTISNFPISRSTFSIFLSPKSYSNYYEHKKKKNG